MENTPITMPHSRSAEEAFLGSLVIDPEQIRRTTVQADDFYIERNGFIYTAIRELTRQNLPVDYVSICVYLDEHKQLNEIGGPAYITNLINASPSSVNIEAYAETIKTRSMRRKIIRTAQKLAGSAFALDSNIDTVISETMELLSKTIVSNKGARPISEFVSAVYDEVQYALEHPQDIYGIPSGFRDIDRITYGWQKGEKVLLSGEPGVGKSVLATQFLIEAAKRGRFGALYELEMSGRQVVRRALAGQTKVAPGDAITTQKMRQGKLTEQELPSFIHAVEIMSGLPIYMSDSSEMTSIEIRADLARLKDLHNVEMVVIDYEGLLGDDPDQKDENVRTKAISKRVHDIAKDLDIAVIAIGDMTKEGIKQQVKGQASVAGTARSLHDADQIVIIRKNGDDGSSVRLTWEKMREGESDRVVDLVRIPGYPMFAETARL